VLLPTAASKTSRTISFSSSVGNSAVLEDVLFGEGAPS